MIIHLRKKYARECEKLNILLVTFQYFVGYFYLIYIENDLMEQLPFFIIKKKSDSIIGLATVYN